MTAVRTPTYRLRPAAERGTNKIAWLNANFSFSFANYYDPQWSGFRDLLVLNEDYIAPSGGFGTHGHEHMEIISYVLDGGIAHQDSTGGKEVIRHGEVQVMHAGTGIRHSEFNDSDSVEAHMLQIWIQPNSHDVEPGYEQKAFPVLEPADALTPIASPDGHDGSMVINANAAMYAGTLKSGLEVSHQLQAGNNAWIQVANGSLEVDGHSLQAGDGLAIADTDQVVLRTAGETAEIVLIELD